MVKHLAGPNPRHEDIIMPKAAEPPSTSRRPDHELLVLGEALTETNQRLGAEDLAEIERIELTEKWSDIIDARCSVEAKSQTGRRIKAGAIIIAFARTGTIHKVALSLAGDILACGQRQRLWENDPDRR
jgi:hypothetical protein